jgi:hypothetical protein
MQVDYSVELGRDDESLKVPWSAPKGTPRYYDLKRQPDLLIYVEEASRYPELSEFLSALNSSKTGFETAKCDVWSTGELSEEEKIFGSALKFGSYVDLLFTSEDKRASFQAHEEVAQSLKSLLEKVPEMSASTELIIRRAYFHRKDKMRKRAGKRERTRSKPSLESAAPESGYYITLYIFGYGDEEPEARQRWAIALKLVENALRQISARG